MASNVGTSAVNGFTAFSMEVSPAERNLLSDLRSQLNSVMVRFEELQRENHRLLSRISSCQCSEPRKIDLPHFHRWNPPLSRSLSSTPSRPPSTLPPFPAPQPYNLRPKFLQLPARCPPKPTVASTPELYSGTVLGGSWTWFPGSNVEYLVPWKIKYPEHFTSYSAKSEGISQSIKQDSELSMSESSTNTSFSNNKFEVSSKDCKHSLHVEKFSNCTSLEQIKQPDQRVVTHEYDKRYVALKIVYFGLRFYGFASEAQMEPTVESEIFKALERTKLLVGTRKESHYSRCGRTDKGVSATGQVISLYLRSNGKHIGEKEIDYVKVLNKALPKDIRVIGSASVSPEFSARFSCLNREYRYLFWRGTMDISVMQNAARKFIGEHDFRNFCKMDAVNVNNYKRLITEFSVHPCSKWPYDDKLWAITIKGSAFLWHQVRCMVSILFMIGGGLESPNIIDALLDVNKTLRKPQYTMASELPLMLHCCEFQDVKFICSSDAMKNLVGHLTNELRSNLLQAAIVEEALNCLQTLVVEESPVQHHRKKKGHVSLVLRPMEPSYEERRLKLAMRDSYSRPAS